MNFNAWRFWNPKPLSAIGTMGLLRSHQPCYHWRTIAWAYGLVNQLSSTLFSIWLISLGDLSSIVWRPVWSELSSICSEFGQWQSCGESPETTLIYWFLGPVLESSKVLTSIPPKKNAGLFVSPWRIPSHNAPAVQSPIRCLVLWKGRSREHFPKRWLHFGERIPAENGKKPLQAGW